MPRVLHPTKFVSSFTFYHGSLFYLVNAINPTAEYLRHNKKHPDYMNVFDNFRTSNSLRPWKTLQSPPIKGQEERRESTADLEYEIEKFLTRPYDFIRENDPSSVEGGWWGWMATVRPQLLFFGVSPNGFKVTCCFNKLLTQFIVLGWKSYSKRAFAVVSWIGQGFRSISNHRRHGSITGPGSYWIWNPDRGPPKRRSQQGKWLSCQA